MANFFIAWGNQADTATLSAGSWESALPLNNLKDYRVTKVARTTNDATSSTKFRCALANPAYIGALALANTNASVEAGARWRIFTDGTYTTEQYNSAWNDVYPVGTIPFGQIPFGAPNWWTARPEQAEVDRWQGNITHVLSTAQYGQYIEFELDDTANPDGWFQPGRLFVGQAVTPTYNASYGPKLQIKSRTNKTRARDGTPYFDPRAADFSIAFALDWLSENEAMRLLDMQALIDVHGEVLFMWDHGNVAYAHRRSVFGRLAELDPIAHPLFATYTLPVQIEGTLR